MSIVKLELSALRKHCEKEINLYLQGQDIDGRYCYEMFRRCLQDRDQNAWEQAYNLFEPQFARWVRSHRLFFNSGEEVSYFVNRALEKIWSAIPPEKFSKFANLKQLLSYLKMCVGSSVVDYYRKQEKSRLGFENLRDKIEVESTTQALRTENSELWTKLDQLMKNKNERVVLYASFVLGLKPKEINAEFSSIFSSVKEIYRIKENILSRFRRDQELMNSLGELGE
jgi:DNA-directed RNA polymerase specialized sigma24 family protein